MAVYAVIVAGGSGSRMGNIEKPKQFLEIAGKPIIIHTIEKFAKNDNFKSIIICCNEKWIEYTVSILKKQYGDLRESGRKKLEYINEDDAVFQIVAAGETRNETLMNAIRYIEENDGLYADTIVVTHDAVRPCVTERIINDNIRCVLEKGICDTVIPATDTIVRSDNQLTIDEVPERKNLFQSQTPQSFNALKMKTYYGSLTEEEKASLTDAVGIFVMKGEDVYMVKGEVYNIKITYFSDLKVAETYMHDF